MPQLWPRFSDFAKAAACVNQAFLTAGAETSLRRLVEQIRDDTVADFDQSILREVQLARREERAAACARDVENAAARLRPLKRAMAEVQMCRRQITERAAADAKAFRLLKLMLADAVVTAAAVVCCGCFAAPIVAGCTLLVVLSVGLVGAPLAILLRLYGAEAVRGRRTRPCASLALART